MASQDTGTMKDFRCHCGANIGRADSWLVFSRDRVEVGYGYGSDFGDGTYAFCDGYRWERGRRFLAYLDEATVRQKYPGDGICDNCTHRMIREGILRCSWSNDFYPRMVSGCDRCGFQEIENPETSFDDIESSPFFDLDPKILSDSDENSEPGTQNQVCCIVLEQSGKTSFFHYKDSRSLPHSCCRETLRWKYGLAESKLLSHEMLVCRSCVLDLIESGFLVSEKEIDENFPTYTTLTFGPDQLKQDRIGYQHDLYRNAHLLSKKARAEIAEVLSATDKEISFLEQREEVMLAIRNFGKTADRH